MFERNVVAAAKVYPANDHRLFMRESVGSASFGRECIEVSVSATTRCPIIRFEDDTYVIFEWEDLIRSASNARANIPRESAGDPKEQDPSAS